MINHSPHTRRPSFYLDPENPGQARHFLCFTRAGIHPAARGYLPSEGPCWVCAAIAMEYTRYSRLLASIEAKIELAESLERFSEACFELSKEVMRATGTGRVERRVIESEAHAGILRRFKESLATAKKKAQEPGEPETSWYRAEMPPESGTLVSPARFLTSDPTERSYVSLYEIGARGGGLSVLSRGFLEDAKAQAARAQITHGKDPDDLAMLLAGHLKASPQALAEVIVTDDRPHGRLSDEDCRKADALAQRWRTRACRTRSAAVQPMPQGTRTALAAKRDLLKNSPRQNSQRRKKTLI